MHNKIEIAQGLKIRSNCKVGYKWYFAGREGSTTPQQIANNRCLDQRDKRTLDCLGKWESPDHFYCQGNNNGKELDRCMATVWSPSEMVNQRPLEGIPYHSDLGDKCFKEYHARHLTGMNIDQNTEEWNRCVATFM